MLEDFYKNNSYEVLKRTAEDRSKSTRKCQKLALQQTTKGEEKQNRCRMDKPFHDTFLADINS